MTLAEKPGCQDIFKPPNIVMSVQLSKYTMFKELHEAWGHLSYDTISRMYGLPVPRDMPPCITCLVSKATQLPIRETQMLSRPSEGPSRVWLIDMKGKIPVSTKVPYNCVWLLLLKCANTGYRVLYLLQSKSAGPVCMKKFDLLLRTLPSKFQIAITTGAMIHGDNEFNVNPWLKEFGNIGLSFECSPPYTKQLNGGVEREWRTIFNLVRAQLHQLHLPLDLWGLCAQHTVYLLNRGITQPRLASAYERFTGIKVDYSFMATLPVFGTGVVVPSHVAISTLSVPGRKGIFVGVSTANNCMRVLLDDSSTIIETQHGVYTPLLLKPNDSDVMDNELVMLLPVPSLSAPSVVLPSVVPIVPPLSVPIVPPLSVPSLSVPSVVPPSVVPIVPPSVVPIIVPPVVPSLNHVPPASICVPTPQSLLNTQPVNDQDDVDGFIFSSSISKPTTAPPRAGYRSERLHAKYPPAMTAVPVNVHMEEASDMEKTLIDDLGAPSDSDVPGSFKEAMGTPQGRYKWEKAIQDEVAKLTKYEVFEEITDPSKLLDSDGKPVKLFGSRYVFSHSTKTGAGKARLVFGGHHQRPGRDYDPQAVYSPTAALAVARMGFAFAATNDWYVDHEDIASAFLKAKLPEDGPQIFMKVPDGFPLFTKDGVVRRQDDGPEGAL